MLCRPSAMALRHDILTRSGSEFIDKKSEMEPPSASVDVYWRPIDGIRRQPPESDSILENEPGSSDTHENDGEVLSGDGRFTSSQSLLNGFWSQRWTVLNTQVTRRK